MRPSRLGSKSLYVLTFSSIRAQPRPTSSASACGHPKRLSVPTLMSSPRGTSGHSRSPRTDGRTACHTSTYGWPRMRTPGTAEKRSAICCSFEPRTRWSTSTPALLVGDGENSARHSSSRSTPRSSSTTTPSRARSAPQILATSSASCLPSTQMRDSRAVRALALTWKEPEAVRALPAGAFACGRTSSTGRPSIQNPRPSGKDRRTPLRPSSSTCHWPATLPTRTISPTKPVSTSSTTSPRRASTGRDSGLCAKSPRRWGLELRTSLP